MQDEVISKRVLQLREVEKLSLRQIAATMGIDRKRVARILKADGASTQRPKKESIVESYRNLIAYWYRQYPRLKAKQIYDRLLSYGYQGSYASVVRFSRQYRQTKQVAYHTLNFLPGEEAQIDWFFFKHDSLGMLAGFLYVLAYSRYGWGMFYPKTSFEFFLDGHLKCFEHLGGCARRHRYDNIKSVVLARYPFVQYNPQFLDFSRFYGFSICLCNPYKGNEKGRVERLIRDIRSFLDSETFADIDDLNRKFQAWLKVRNNTVHRSTQKTPQQLLERERLIVLPQAAYRPSRIIPAVVSKTALIEFETNKYSVPSSCANKSAQIIALPDKIEVCVNSQKVAHHKRSFAKGEIIQSPLHAEKLLNQTPQFKMKRIFELIERMDPAFAEFLQHQESDTERIGAAYQLFCLLKTHSRTTLTSALRELNQLGSFKIKALLSLLRLPQPKEGDALWPQNTQLLNLDYEERSLEDYDPD